MAHRRLPWGAGRARAAGGRSGPPRHSRRRLPDAGLAQRSRSAASAASSPAIGGLDETQSVPSNRAVRPEAASSVAPVVTTTGAPCVLASERPAHPDDERGSAKPSWAYPANGSLSSLAERGSLHPQSRYAHERAGGGPAEQAPPSASGRSRMPPLRGSLRQGRLPRRLRRT